MSDVRKTARALLVCAVAVGLPGAALADDSGGLNLSVTLGATSDYIFRGISQTSEDPAAQGSVDLTYGIFYAGIWATNVDFDGAPPANAEIDLYAGIKPTWTPPISFLGPVTFDFGVIYYAYPDAGDRGAELDYVELKAGYSMESVFIKGLTSGTTVYWSPEYGGDTGEVITVESHASYALPQIGIFAPSVSGGYGTVYGDFDEGFSVDGTREDQYMYWNVGLELAVEKFTFDFRYWDTDIDVAPGAGGICVSQGLCDERFVFTASVTLP